MNRREALVSTISIGSYFLVGDLAKADTVEYIQDYNFLSNPHSWSYGKKCRFVEQDGKKILSFVEDGTTEKRGILNVFITYIDKPLTRWLSPTYVLSADGTMAIVKDIAGYMNNWKESNSKEVFFITVSENLCRVINGDGSLSNAVDMNTVIRKQ